MFSSHVMHILCCLLMRSRFQPRWSLGHLPAKQTRVFHHHFHALSDFPILDSAHATFFQCSGRQSHSPQRGHDIGTPSVIHSPQDDAQRLRYCRTGLCWASDRDTRCQVRRAQAVAANHQRWCVKFIHSKSSRLCSSQCSNKSFQ